MQKGGGLFREDKTTAVDRGMGNIHKARDPERHSRSGREVNGKKNGD